MKKKFDGAQEVRQRKRRGRRMLEPRFQRFKPHTDTDLVFLKESPSYCEMDIQQGSLGTRGRECDPVSTQKHDVSKEPEMFHLNFRAKNIQILISTGKLKCIVK